MLHPGADAEFHPRRGTARESDQYFYQQGSHSKNDGTSACKEMVRGDLDVL